MRHNHSCVCSHENVKFCRHCNTVYCVDCNQEWTAKSYNQWNGYPWYTNTDQWIKYVQSPTVISGGGGNGPVTGTNAIPLNQQALMDNDSGCKHGA